MSALMTFEPLLEGFTLMVGLNVMVVVQIVTTLILFRIIQVLKTIAEAQAQCLTDIALVVKQNNQILAALSEKKNRHEFWIAPGSAKIHNKFDCRYVSDNHSKVVMKCEDKLDSVLSGLLCKECCK